MARREVVQFYDDLDNTPLTEEEVNTIRFSVDGTAYILDLKKENADQFRENLQRYVEVARKDLSAFAAPRRRYQRNNRTREIRQWALDNGKDVPLRGRVPFKIIEEYEAAHASS